MVQYSVMVTKDNGKTWTKIGENRASLATARKELHRQLGALKDGYQIRIVRLYDTYKASLNPLICENCGKPYEHSENIELKPVIRL